MLKLFWIGNPYFINSLAQTETLHIKFHDFSAYSIYTWSDIVNLANFEPDVVVVADKSMPPFVLGMENFPCLTVFYAVDAHLHSWFPYYAQGFDLCLLSLKDYVQQFSGPFLPTERIFWFPAFAQDHCYPNLAKPLAKKWDCIFVGSINAATPKRKIFLETLQTELPNFYVTSGNYAELFPQAKVVLNFCEYGDLNFRVFEAQGMGSALVTPIIENGQAELFQNNEHFLLYDPSSLSSCTQAIQTLLTDDHLRLKLERQGLQAINANHRARHRAKTFLNILNQFVPQKDQMIQQRFQLAKDIRKHSLRLVYLLWANDMHEPTHKELLLNYAKISS